MKTYDIHSNSIKIYYTRLTPERNALLDIKQTNLYGSDYRGPFVHATRYSTVYLDSSGIEHYLNALPGYEGGDPQLLYYDVNFQFIKPALDITIKIDISKNAAFNNLTYNCNVGNYVRIIQKNGATSVGPIDPQTNEYVKGTGTNIPILSDDVAVWYYFIVDQKWVSQKTVELKLSLDTLNTFGYWLLNENNWSDKTSIIREHINRYENVNDQFIKKIDRVGEDISIPYLLETDNINIEEPNSTGVAEWYLVYKTQNSAMSEDADSLVSNNSLKAYIYPKTSIVYQQQAGIPGSTFTYTPSTLTATPAIYGITTGSVSFSNIAVYPKYGSYGSNLIHYHATPSASSFTTFNSGSTITGHVGVGDTFSVSGKTYTCWAVVWFKNRDTTGDSSWVDLPIGLFKCSADDKVHYALYINSINSTTINKWCFREREAIYEFGWKYLVVFCPEEFSHGFTEGAIRPLQDTSYRSDNWALSNYDTNWARNSLYFKSGTLTFTADTQKVYNIGYDVKTPTASGLNSGNVFKTNGSAGSTGKISSIGLIDRTDSKLVKIIALPYCPTEISISSGSIESGNYTISFDANIVELEDGTDDESGYKLIKYKYVQNTFGKYLNYVSFDYKATDEFLEYAYSGNPYSGEPKPEYDFRKVKPKNIDNEPKLLHSNYYKDLFIYDSVNKCIRREDILPDEETVAINTYYQPTNTLTSSMLFKFEVDGGTYSEITPWDNILISSRNNELPIYNNAYLNYMRYGYNAEQTNLNASAEAQRQAYTTNAVLGIFGGTVGGAGTGAAMGAKFGGGYGAAAGAIIGAGIGLATSIAKSASAIKTTETAIENAQRSLNSKVEALQNTAITVQGGASAVDLMTNYSDNRLHYATYEVPELMKEALYDRFYYCGYAHPVQEKPNLWGRVCFNFVQCEPVFDNNDYTLYGYGLIKNYIEDIKERFRVGVTVYHIPGASWCIFQDGYLDTLYDFYDFDQAYENWEVQVNAPNYTYIEDSLYFVNPIHPTDAQKYLITYDWLNSLDPDVQQYKPAADNSYRYQVILNDYYYYVYTSQQDTDNGYTLTQKTLDPLSDAIEAYLENVWGHGAYANKIGIRVVNTDTTTNVRPLPNLEVAPYRPAYEASIEAELNLVIEVLKDEGGDTNNYDATFVGYYDYNKWRWRCDDGTVFFTDSPKVLTSSTIYRETAPGVFEADPDTTVSQIKSVWNYL